ncbi:MAG: mannose-1-phosphate guanylyltransferase/mannose-6-phosphate isomerase [Roseovarius sp.]|nr:mannose-1-phosphate guanylyltransferase/mannose-6-phosphate isomerase [Roseovarius sp.]
MITPVLLTGGSGTRLWPVSRKSYPKQFVAFRGGRSLFQDTLQRLSGPGFAAPMAMTGEAFRFIVAEQMQAEGMGGHRIYIEPEGRNTAPALLVAALALVAEDADALMLAAPADHLIPDPEAFRATVLAGVDAARTGQIVTFGIQPDQPETGYGYLELNPASDAGPGPHPLVRFIEKPDLTSATEMVASGHYLWNSGLFLMQANTLIGAFETHAPHMLAPARAALSEGMADLDFHRLDAGSWAGLDDISIDYAVMEKADNLMALRYDGGWSDLGGWDAMWRAADPDNDGVATEGAATALDCTNTFLRSENENLQLVGLGLDNIVAVATRDAVLVADMSRAQDVKKVVQTLKANDITQAESFPIDYRPWGWFETLALGRRFQVKRIVVKPGGSLSLQSHMHRAEHWIVVQGTAKVTVDDTVTLVSENQSIYVPLGAIHRMENPGKVEMVLIEVQTGSYLGEDDIVRYEDIYNRG